MPLVSAHSINPLSDGRQSDRALAIRRGVQLLLRDHGFAIVPEMTLANGRRADLIALGGDGSIVIVEIKSSPEDFLADHKWPDYRDFCDRFYFATLPDVPQSLFPDACGFIRADGHGAAILVDAPEHRLAAARRKALTLRFARFAADRLTAAEWADAGFNPA